MLKDKHARNIILLLVLVTFFAAIIAITGTEAKPQYISQTKKSSMKKENKGMMDDVKNGIHVPTGFIADTNFELVVNNCTACHAPNLVIQNRMTEEGWNDIIDWMQEKQNLWDLGPNRKKIVDYLAKNYAPKDEGRRKQLSLNSEDWYVLD